LEALLDHTIEEAGADSPLVEDIYERMDSLDPETFESRSATILHGLGFTSEMMQKKTKDLSGGWRMRVSLAKALFVRPTLLLLGTAIVILFLFRY
jgi:ATP-binding cassette subfamily F protein 2